MRDWPEPDQDTWLAYLDHFSEPDDDYYYRRFEEAKIRAEANVGANEDEIYYDQSDNAPYCPMCGVDCSCQELTREQEAAAQADYENELAIAADVAAAQEFYEETQTNASTATSIASSKAILAAAKAKTALSEVQAVLLLDKSLANETATVKVREEVKSSLVDVEKTIFNASTILATVEENKSTLTDVADALAQFHLFPPNEANLGLIEVKTALIQVKVVLADAKIDLAKAKVSLADAEAQDAIADAEAKTEIKNTFALAEADVAQARIDMEARTKTKAKVEVSVEQVKNQGIEARDISNEIEAIATMYEDIMNREHIS